jgi:Alkylmercury lyase
MSTDRDDLAAFDRSVRSKIYELFVTTARAPGVETVAAALEVSPESVAGSFGRLGADHAIVLAPGTLDLWMANPLSAVPTAFTVEARGHSFWGSCIWDALGIPVMLGTDGLVTSMCGDCREPMQLEVRAGELEPAEGLAHYAVPAARWWDDIGFS